MSKRLWVLPIMVVLLVVGVVGLAQAIPSLGGPTGVVMTPTAEIAPQDLLSVVLTYQAIKAGGDDLRDWELHALGSIGEQAELWLAYSTIDNTFDSTLWGAGAKVQVYRVPEPATAIAIGGGWMQWSDGLLDWAASLPVEGQIKWTDSIPVGEGREAIKRALGLTTTPPVIPGHELTVTATANPTTVPADGTDAERQVTLTAAIVDTLDKPIKSVHWSLVSPSGAGTFISGQNAEVAVFQVNPRTELTERTITFRVVVVSAASDELTASDQVSVTQAAGTHVMSVEVTATPTTLDQDGGPVDLHAALTDSLAGDTVTWAWDVSPAGAGSFTTGTNTADVQFLVNTFGMYVGEERTITFTATATSTVDSLSASGIASVVQTYSAVGGGQVSSIANALASAPLVTKSALTNLTSAKQTLAAVGAGKTTADFDVNDPVIVALSEKDVTTWNVYGVATIDLTGTLGGTTEWCGPGSKLLGTLGVWYQSVDPDLGDNLTMTQPFVSLKFLGGKGTALGLEYRWKDDDLDRKAVFSAVLSQAFSAGFVGEAGVTNASPIGLGLGDYDWFVRVGYSFPISGM